MDYSEVAFKKADEGIKPDVWVARTLQGYISNRDEQLEKAIEMINKK